MGESGSASLTTLPGSYVLINLLPHSIPDPQVYGGDERGLAQVCSDGGGL